MALTCVAVMPVALAAQDAAKPTTKAASEYSPSKWDIFTGFSYLAPKGTVDVPMPSGQVQPFSYKAVNVGGLFSGAYFFNKFVGAQAEFGLHQYGVSNPATDPIGTRGNNDGFTTIAGGLIGRYPAGDITPFVHGLVGGARIDGPYHNPFRWGPDLTAGGGLDYELPFFNHRFALRVFQADYEYMHANFGPNVYGGRANINAARLSTGVVYHVGTIAPPPAVTMACSANPTTVYPGDPVTVTGTAGNLNPKHNTVYNWSGDGVTGKDATATVNTTNQAPGTYTVKCGVKQGKPGKEGLKPWQTAEGSTTYTVKQFDPPTVTCSANPTTIKPGESSTITATGVSPQNRPLTYTYSAAGGTINGTGNTATYSSTGAPAGTMNITCNVADDKGQTATANSSLTIQAPPPPPVESPEVKQLESRLALHSVFFPTNLPRVTNPNGGLVESQQQTLIKLATDFKRYLELKPNTHLTLTGHTDVRGTPKFNQALSERRVARTKAFLVEQGVPDSSIQTQAVGEEHQLTSAEVKDMLNQNPDLSAAERQKVLRKLAVIVLAQNRRVDITLSTTGQQSVRQFPFNAADAMTLLDQKTPAPSKKKSKK